MNLDEFREFCILCREKDLWLDDYVEAVEFENDKIYIDESVGVEGEEKTLYISSYAQGVVHWNEEKGQYIEHYHFRAKELGQVVKVHMRQRYYDEFVQHNMSLGD